jgi:hypothetical protein
MQRERKRQRSEANNPEFDSPEMVKKISNEELLGKFKKTLTLLEETAIENNKLEHICAANEKIKAEMKMLYADKCREVRLLEKDRMVIGLPEYEKLCKGFSQESVQQYSKTHEKLGKKLIKDELSEFRKIGKR